MKTINQPYMNAVELFYEESCEMPGHWCDGTPIPRSARKYQHDVDLRRRTPCRYLDPEKGCIHPKHPKYKRKSPV